MSDRTRELILAGKCAFTDHDGRTVYLSGSGCYGVSPEYSEKMHTRLSPPAPHKQPDWGATETDEQLEEREKRESRERLAAIPSYDKQEWYARNRGETATAAEAPVGVATAKDIFGDAFIEERAQGPKKYAQVAPDSSRASDAVVAEAIFGDAYCAVKERRFAAPTAKAAPAGTQTAEALFSEHAPSSVTILMVREGKEEAQKVSCNAGETVFLKYAGTEAPTLARAAAAPPSTRTTVDGLVAVGAQAPQLVNELFGGAS